MKQKRESIIKSVKKSVKYILLVYIIYFIFSTLIVFYIHQPDMELWLGQIDPDRFYADQTGQDRVALVEDRIFAGLSRLDLFAKAEETINITLHEFKCDMAGDLFFAAILASADRGVRVRIVLDGMFSNMYNSRRSTQHALVSHPNVELKYYEKINLLKPWTLNNRMHDKFIVIDDKYALIGGRNISERYFFDVAPDRIVEDRDIVIVNTRPNQIENSVISEFMDYFQLLWNSDYVTAPPDIISARQEKSGTARREQMGELLDSFNEVYEYNYNWYDFSVPTNSVKLIHNPLERLNKQPWIWAEITKLIHNAKNSVTIQSPYVVPTKNMLELVDYTTIDSMDISIFTNSMASSPNPFAMSGYKHHRDSIMEHTRLYEYHGQGSIHAKSIIIDERLSLVGSFNIDSRSAFLSTETMVVIDSVEFAAIMKAEIDDLKQSSIYITEKDEQPGMKISQPRETGRPKQVLIFILSFFARFIDVII